ncbi:uncharacterized protein LOC134213505 isoform X2 [Armigeres subalbatus]|uniref:uncharacterized protein LOC134213505 isoform X2 n=1 Tax=Armigeres subalbatus TaxID=124917 RepID=UPI002ED54A50
MDINLLPLELLQHIMSYLDYHTLKMASIVCHRWNKASELFIVRKGNLCITEATAHHLNDLQNCVREYQTIRIHRMDEWSTLQADYLYRFYNTFRSWMEQCELIKVSIDDRFADHLLCGPEDFELSLPNLKHLVWHECLYGYGQKTVTINAPNMECVYIDDSLDASCVVRIPTSDRLKFVRCMFYTKHFDDTFIGSMPNVETLIMTIVYGNCDVGYLQSMHQLRYLSLSFGSAKTSLRNVEAMHDCDQLKVLSITIQDSNSEKGLLRLDKIFNNFIILETLELRTVEVHATGSVPAKHLEFLKLRDVTCSTSSMSVSAPQLKTLSVCWKTLRILELHECDHLKELFLDLESSGLKQSIEHIANFFVLNHKNLSKLVLFRSYQETAIEDDAWYASNDFGLENLELYNIDISINFFRMLSEWKSLKSIAIVRCTINCGAINGNDGAPATTNTVPLPNVARMKLDNVKLRGTTTRSIFPLQFGKVCEIDYTSNSSDLFYNTKHQFCNHDQRFSPFTNDRINYDYTFNPFTQDIIDPLSF